MPHPIPADHISNTNPMDPGREGETINEQGQQELLELHARLAFTGLRPKCSEVGCGGGTHFCLLLQLNEWAVH